jgi:hypothetical protein
VLGEIVEGAEEVSADDGFFEEFGEIFLVSGIDLADDVGYHNCMAI